MNNSVYIVIFYILFSVPISAQAPIQVTPAWEQSFGSREHTNRDELIQMEKDPAGNLILLGFVEGDSIFSDVSLQKITPEGSLVWDYRFDSQNEKDYDVPIKMVLDTEGNITVLGQSLGLVSFFSVQKSNGFLFKVSKEGMLQWEVTFDTLSVLQQHDAGLHCDGYADNLGNFLVCYSAFTEFGPRPTHFIKFSPDGAVLQSYSKSDIAQAFGGGPAAIGQVIDSSGNFIFIEYNENNSPKQSRRSINPENGTDMFIQFNLNNLPLQDSLGYDYLYWQKCWVDDYGDIYSANNLVPPLGPTFYLSKVKANGDVKYVFQPKDSIGIYFTTLEPWRGYAYATGSYLPKNTNTRVSFLWKIDGEGDIEVKRIQSLPQHCVPRFLDIVDGKIYWSTENVVTGEATLMELDAITLGVNWEYSIQKPASFLLSGSNFVTLQDGKVAYGGTLSKEKQPGSGYLSEQDFYVETFSLTPNELYAQYRMSERGTTNVESNAFSIDPLGYIYCRATEIEGPEYYIQQLAPRKYYYRKFSPSGTLIWEKESEHQSYYNYGVAAFYFDYQGNAYTLEYGDQGTYLLVKISPYGEFLGSLSITSFRHLFIDKQNFLHLTSGLGNDNVAVTLVLDSDFQQVSSGYIGLTPVKMFQLPFDNAVYYYMEDNADWGESTVRMILFKDGQQLWEKVFDFQFPEYQQFANHDLDDNTGTLLSSSIWRNSAGFYEFYFHRFTIDDHYTTHFLPTQDNIFPSIGAYLTNGNVYLNYGTKLELYDANFQFLDSISISNAPAGGHFFKLDNTFFRARQGILDVYSGDGQFSFSLTHPSFYFDPARIKIAPNKQLITSDIFGDWIGGGYDFGWRWYRSRIQAFDLSNWISSPTTEPSETLISLRCSPNPVVNSLQVDLKELTGREVRLSLYHTSGMLVASRHFKPLEFPVSNLDVSKLPAGLYLLEASNPGFQTLSQKIVITRP